VDIAVAFLADHECFALTGRHDLYPEGFLGLPFHPQILERSDVVDLDVLISYSGVDYWYRLVWTPVTQESRHGRVGV
jgi:hypothetical protein